MYMLRRQSKTNASLAFYYSLRLQFCVYIRVVEPESEQFWMIEVKPKYLLRLEPEISVSAPQPWFMQSRDSVPFPTLQRYFTLQ